MFVEELKPGDRVEVVASNLKTKHLYSAPRGFVVARPSWVSPPFNPASVYVVFDGQKTPEVAKRDHLIKLGILDRLAREDATET